jgi:hypothetical protein
MPARRRPQSFRGFVREHLAYIERELERGIDHATVRSNLDILADSPTAFRDALYHARRRKRKQPTPAALTPQDAHSLATQGVTTPRAIHSPLVPQRVSSPPSSRPESRHRPRPKPTRSLVVETHRDFLDLVRSTDDSEIY